jgi:hypothetical protein
VTIFSFLLLPDPEVPEERVTGTELLVLDGTGMTRLTMVPEGRLEDTDDGRPNTGADRLPEGAGRLGVKAKRETGGLCLLRLEAMLATDEGLGGLRDEGMLAADVGLEGVRADIFEAGVLNGETAVDAFMMVDLVVARVAGVSPTDAGVGADLSALMASSSAGPGVPRAGASGGGEASGWGAALPGSGWRGGRSSWAELARDVREGLAAEVPALLFGDLLTEALGTGALLEGIILVEAL